MTPIITHFGTPTPLKYTFKICDEEISIEFRCCGDINVTDYNQSKYANQDEVKLEVHPKNIVPIISNAIENNTIDDYLLLINPQIAIGTVIEKFLSTIGITAKVKVISTAMSDENFKICDTLLLKHLEEKRKNKELPSLPKIPHGELIGCEYRSSHTQQFTFQSNAIDRITILKESDGNLSITLIKKELLLPKVTKTFTASADLLQPIVDFVERENMAAWPSLRYVYDPKNKDYDLLTPAYIDLEFNDESIGGKKHQDCSINVYIAYQYGYYDIVKEFFNLLNQCIGQATLINEEIEPDKAGDFFHLTSLNNIPCSASMQVATASEQNGQIITEGAKICPHCGHPGTGKFCTECGSVL